MYPWQADLVMALGHLRAAIVCLYIVTVMTSFTYLPFIRQGLSYISDPSSKDGRSQSASKSSNLHNLMSFAR